MKKQLSLLTIFVALLRFVSADVGDYGCFGGMMGSYGYGWMIFGWIIGILIIVVLVLFIVWVVKQIQKK